MPQGGASSGDVVTVLGPVAADCLGFTSMHEHVLCDGRGFRRRSEPLLPADSLVDADAPVSLETIGVLQRDPGLSWDAVSMLDEELATAEVADFADAGGRTIVDMSAIGLRADLEATRRISRQTGVHIVATTGFYLEDFWPQELRGLDIDDYAALMRREIEQGIDETDVHAGHLKIAIGQLGENEERALRAAARVVCETGLALTVHPGYGIGNGHPRIVRILSEEEAPPQRVVLAHTQAYLMESEDLATLVLEPAKGDFRLDVHRELLAGGYTLSIDCFGQQWSAESAGWVLETDWQRLAELVGLIREGYSEQLVIGSDVFLKILTRRGGGYGYRRLTDFVLPWLRRLKVSEYDIRTITIDNPARILSRETKGVPGFRAAAL